MALDLMGYCFNEKRLETLAFGQPTIKRLQLHAQQPVGYRVPAWQDEETQQLQVERACNFHSDCTVGKI